MSLKERLEKNAAAVEKVLTDLTAQSDADFGTVQDAVRYSLLSGKAKRIRPTLVMEFCRLFGGSDDAALPFAAAVEMVHTYSLIHDDLPAMDNDDLRRGRPTCHKAFGEATALLAGDGLLTLAFGVLASDSAVPDSAVRAAVAALSRAAGNFGMIGGQVMDLHGETEKLSLDSLIRLHAHKTGALMAVSAELGCLAAGLSTDDGRLLRAVRYAKGVGLAFQILDDVLDATSDEETMGKSVGTDAVRGKTTFLTYFTVPEAIREARRITEDAKKELSDISGNGFLLELADSLIDRRC